MNLEELQSRGEMMQEELGREYYETGCGNKRKANFQDIYDKYDDLTGDEALGVVRASGSTQLTEWVVGLRTGKKVAQLDEKRHSWEQEATVSIAGACVPYLKVPIEISNSSDREYRKALDTARSRLAAGNLTDLLRERFRVEHEEVEALDLGDYVAAVGRLADIDLDDLGRQADAFLTETADIYRDSLTRLVAKRLGAGVNGLVRSDAAWVFRADDFDHAFDPAGAVQLAVDQMREMGLDAAQAGRVHFDTEDRPGKQPRAFCVPVRVPHEVYLVLRPRGGHYDYRTLWHELGHAMHFASVDPEMSFEARWLGDNSVTEGFAMLWDHLTLDGDWLRQYTALSGRDVANLAFELAVSELYMLRRYAAKLCYELALHRSDFCDAGGEYVDRLTSATLFTYPAEDWLLDVDAGFYAARYLRAWQLEAAIASELRERFDTDWYRNPRAGSFVQHLMSRGQADPAHRLTTEVTGCALTFDAARARVAGILS